MNTLNHYIEVTKPFGEQNGVGKLLLSVHKPHKAITKYTVANWIKKVLSNSGIDTEIYKAHSIRSASSSAAAVGGVGISDILARGVGAIKTLGKNSITRKLFHLQKDISKVY